MLTDSGFTVGNRRSPLLKTPLLDSADPGGHADLSTGKMTRNFGNPKIPGSSVGENPVPPPQQPCNHKVPEKRFVFGSEFILESRFFAGRVFSRITEHRFQNTPGLPVFSPFEGYFTHEKLSN